MADNPTCETCRWWDAWHNGAISGNCHRYAPRPGDEVDMGNWPAVSAGKWCGEHAPRVEAPNAGPTQETVDRALAACIAMLRALRKESPDASV